MNDPNVEAIYPLSPAQERILFPPFTAGESLVNVEQRVIVYRGPLESACLRRAWQRMVDRHAILRTVFAWESQGELLQFVRRTAALDWSEQDWRGRPAAGQAAALELFLHADRERGFDVTQAPPVRFSLIRTADDESHLVWGFHPILLDESSVAILGREVAACYEAFAQGLEPESPPVRPYSDYIKWLRGRDVARAEAFWRCFLDGFTAPGRIEASSAAASEAGRFEEHAELSDATGAALQALARERKLGVGAVLRAVWAVLVSRLVGEQDVLFGATFCSRTPEVAGIGSMIGPFTGTLPVRVQFTEGETFLVAVKRQQDLESELQQHQHARLAESRARSSVIREIPHLETLVALEDDAFDRIPYTHLPGIAVRDVQSWSHKSFPVYLRIRRGDRFRLSLTCSSNRFSAPAVRGLLQQVCGLLDQALERPECTLDQLSLVTPESRVVLPNPAAALAETDFPPVTVLFDSWTRRSPQATALRQHDRSLTYEELSDRARAVAQALSTRGCLPGEVVALDGLPGFGLIAGLLGILLAGGVVLMVDRRLPAERKRLMCREANAKHLICLSGEAASEELRAERPWGAIISVELASGNVTEANDVPETATLREPSGEDGAYIFFTSGTTGVPKGVLGTHRGLSHFLAWQRETFGVGPGDRSSQLTGLSFDVVLREIFLPLTSGATLCLPDQPDELGAEEIIPWLEREGITTLHTVPTLAESWLLALPRGASLRAMRRVFFAGEPLGGRLVRRWRTAFGDSAQIVNLYGPTETTLAKCYHIVTVEPEEGIQPVGRPLPESQALVLSEKGRPCGIGEWGEIVIRTSHRTRGYVNAPNDGRQRFRPNPFRSDERDLLYHTGDRGRYRADGVLEISGRLDDQVKINGVRVEPGEIAAVLSQYPAVRQCTILGQKNSRGGVSLAAYVVSDKNASLAPLELKAYLRTRLPEYMVPSSFAFLEQLPLTPNGKVDRKKLVKITSEADAMRADHVPPRTATEELVAGIWAEVLGAERVGVEENFFDIGGDSLLMMQVISRARLRGLRLTHLTMFRYPSVRSLAAHLDGNGATAPGYQGVRDRARLQREARARQKLMLGRR